MDQMEMILTAQQSTSTQTTPKLQGNTEQKTNASGETTSFQDQIKQKQKNTATDTGKTSQNTEKDSKAGDIKKPTEDNAVITDGQRELAAALAMQAATVQPANNVPVAQTMVIQQVLTEAAGVNSKQMASNGSTAIQADGLVQINSDVQTVAAAQQNASESKEGTTKTVNVSGDIGKTDNVTVVSQPVTIEKSSTQSNTNTSENTPFTDSSGTSATNKQDDGTDQTGASVSVGNRTLFHDVQAVPVKVSDSSVVDTNSSQMDNQIADQVTKALDQGITHVKVQLSPESLGTVTVEMTRSQDGALHVLLKTTGQQAQSLLEQHSSGLQALLAERSQNTVNVQVQRNQEGQATHGDLYDREGQGQQQSQQESRRQRQQNEDFIQQLRLNLISVDDEAS